MSYLDSIALIRTVPCLAAPGKLIVIGAPTSPIGEVIPYLASLPGVISYHPVTLTLTFRRTAGFMTLHPEKIYITQVGSVDEGLELLQALADAVNATWENRAQLVAAAAARRSPRHLDVYALLPQTNCKQCGEPTCLAFAVLLIQQKHVLSECPPLQQNPLFVEQRATLESMF